MLDIETAAYMSDCSYQFRFVLILASKVTEMVTITLNNFKDGCIYSGGTAKIFDVDRRIELRIDEFFTKYYVGVEIPSHESTRYLPNSLVVRFDKDQEHLEGKSIQGHTRKSADKGEKTLYDMIKQDRKLKLFMDIFYVLAGEDNDAVNIENLILELVNTCKFTEQEAHTYIAKAQSGDLISERSKGIFVVT
jgi:hypothetical protein